MPHHACVLLNRLLARGKFRHVQVLLKLAEVGSVQRTASAIGMSQSSVTQMLAYLEDLLEVELFERHVRGVRPTAACADLLPIARNLLLGVSEGAEVIAARRQRGQGSVRLLASSAATSGVLVGALAAFCDRHPSIQIHLTEAEGEDQLLAIARGEVDLAVIRERSVVPEGWRFDRLLEEEFAVICGTGHPLAREARVEPQDLADATWLLSPVGTSARDRFEKLAGSLPSPPRSYPVVTRSATLIPCLLRERDVLAFVPRSFVQRHLGAGELAELELGERIPLPPLALLSRLDDRAEGARALAEFLVRHSA